MNRVIFLLIVTTALIVNGCPSDHPVASCCERLDKFFSFSISGPRISGVNRLNLFCRDCHEEVDAYCDGLTDGGGWLVIQRRQDGSVDFNRTWEEYENGFGNLTTEFWYGLKPLHCLTGEGGWQLRVDFKLTDGGKNYLLYNRFSIGSVRTQYQLSISNAVNNGLPDVFRQHDLNGMKFTTKDRDNDRWNRNCAIDSTGAAGGWWYRSCSLIQPNHKYQNENNIFVNGQRRPVSFIEIKIRPINNC